MPSFFTYSFDQFDDGYVASDLFSNFDSTVPDFPPPIYTSSNPVHFSSGISHNGLILPEEEGHALRMEEREREYAVEQSARVIDAYRTLTDPLSRATYLIKLEGVPVDEEKKITDPDLHVEVLLPTMRNSMLKLARITGSQ